MDPPAAEAITALTNSPGLVFGVPTSQIPQHLRQIPGVSSYYVSAYGTGIPTRDGLTVGGEMLIVRPSQGLTKNDQFIFAKSSDGNFYVTGPFKGYGHHVRSDAGIEVNSMFHQTPFSPKK